MPAPDKARPALPRASTALNQAFRDPARSADHETDVALRHHNGARLSEARPGRAATVDRDRELTVTSALKLPQSSPLTSSWPETPPGADPLPGQLDRWLAARGADLVAVRRHIHAHPELSHQEFETAALVALELKRAGLTPRLLPKGNGVLCDIGAGDRVVALRADLDALP